MKKLTFIMIFVFCFALICCRSIAYAGFLDYLTLGTINELEDQDRETLIDNDEDGLIRPGDCILGIFWIEQNTVSPDPPIIFTDADNTLTGTSLLKVTSVTITDGGNTANYVFGAPSAADLAEAGLPSASEGTMISLYDDPPSAPFPHIDNTTIAGGIASATNGTLLWGFGLTGAEGEFATAIATDSSGEADNFLNMDTFVASLNLNTTSESAATGSIGLLPHTGLFPQAGDFQALMQMTSGGGGAFDITTDTEIKINPHPEPTTIAMFGLLGGLMAIKRRFLSR